MLHLKESDVVSLLPSHSEDPCEITPSSEALHQPCYWCRAAISPFTLSSDSNFTSSSSHRCTDLIGCPLPREKWGEREIREEGRKKKKGGREEGDKETPSLNVLKHYTISQEGEQQRGKERKEREKWRENEGWEVGGKGRKQENGR